MKQVSKRLHKIMIYFHAVCIFTVVLSAMFMSMAYNGMTDWITLDDVIGEAYYHTVNWFMYAAIYILVGWALSSIIVEQVVKKKGYVWRKKDGNELL